MFTLTPIREEHLQVRVAAHAVESGALSEEMYATIKANAAESREPDSLRTPQNKSISSKEDACCGRGCNGCLKFWHDDKYARAREILAKKQTGERLQNKCHC